MLFVIAIVVVVCTTWLCLRLTWWNAWVADVGIPPTSIVAGVVQPAPRAVDEVLPSLPPPPDTPYIAVKASRSARSTATTMWLVLGDTAASFFSEPLRRWVPKACLLVDGKPEKRASKGGRKAGRRQRQRSSARASGGGGGGGGDDSASDAGADADFSATEPPMLLPAVAARLFHDLRWLRIDDAEAAWSAWPRHDDDVYTVFRHVWLRGFHLTTGLRFGCDFLVYTARPGTTHSVFTLRVMPPPAADLRSHGTVSIAAATRVAHTAGKTLLLAFVEPDTREVRFVVTPLPSGLARK